MREDWQGEMQIVDEHQLRDATRNGWALIRGYEVEELEDGSEIAINEAVREGDAEG